MEVIEISKRTARRFVMGLQGLWPGRRWSGVQGTDAALHTIEAIQLDPLNVVARSHDLALWGRVVDYRPEHLYQLLYTDRRGFDYGGGLFVYPMSELPYWRLHMRRKVQEPRWANFAAEHAHILEQVRTELRQRGPLGNRDFTGNARVNSYRGSKDTSLALYYLWLAGELMIADRKGFERIYNFCDKIAPPELNYMAQEIEAEEYFARKAIAFLGIMRERRWAANVSDYIQRRIDKTEAKTWLNRLIEQGEVAQVQIEGSTEGWLALETNRPLLESLQCGEIPTDWRACLTNTTEEAVFLAPLDIVSARGRAAILFDFEYIWEVYKPAAQRRWGYYTLPILYEDRLVGRLDPRLVRSTMTLIINGFWLEEDTLAGDPSFAEALGRGLARFAAFLEARHVNIASITPQALRLKIQKITGQAVDVQV